MRQGVVRFKYRIVILGIFQSRLFDNYPTEEQMKEFVSSRFPTFHAEGEPVTWQVEKIFFLED
ncbi:hypothetical protein [Ornithinibacillus sp. JPR2-1]|uniref:hypothetical protein n=1 Tax=Ornithinibacillus sp. JPR2-1 TaxID=2094019 RepID=UPI0031D63659